MDVTETVFGGIEIDLWRFPYDGGRSGAENFDAVLGGAEVNVPDTWLGDHQSQWRQCSWCGVINSTKAPDPKLVPNPKRLIVKGSAVFGGVEIKN